MTLAAQRPDELREGVEANLRSLRVERQDLVDLRLVDARHDGAVAYKHQATPTQIGLDDES